MEGLTRFNTLEITNIAILLGSYFQTRTVFIKQAEMVLEVAKAGQISDM